MKDIYTMEKPLLRISGGDSLRWCLMIWARDEWWIRLAGRGIGFRNHRRTGALFSERYNGRHGVTRRHYVHVRQYCICTLPPVRRSK